MKIQGQKCNYENNWQLYIDFVQLCIPVSLKPDIAWVRGVSLLVWTLKWFSLSSVIIINFFVSIFELGFPYPISQNLSWLLVI